MGHSLRDVDLYMHVTLILLDTDASTMNTRRINVFTTSHMLARSCEWFVRLNQIIQPTHYTKAVIEQAINWA
jgi:plasmid rolling circle replication initiator protein Rep